MNLMDTIYINTQFDEEDIHSEPSIEKKYTCSYCDESIGFKLLMKLVLLTKKNNEAIPLIRKLLNENPNTINQINSQGWTALMLAATNSGTCSTENTVQILIDAGAELNLQISTGWTALILAARNSNRCSTENTVKMLIDAGADINLQTNKGWTALILASKYSKTGSTEKTG